MPKEEEKFRANDDRRTYRRRFLRGIGATAVVGVAAGCLDDVTGDGDDGNEGDGNGEHDHDDHDHDDGNGGAENGNDDENGDSGNGDTGTGNGDDGNGDAENGDDGNGNTDGNGGDGNGDDGNGDDDNEQTLNPEEWESVDSIRFLGRISGWEGVEPEMIEGIQNPTILLFEGEEYEITWENDDGGGHNFEIWDEDNQVVNDYATEVESGMDVVQTLKVEATAEMARYVCMPHSGMMRGDIVIE